MAVAEVFYHAFSSFHRFWWFKSLFPAFGIIAVGISVLIAATHPPVQASEPLSALFVLEIVIRCLQIAAFFLIIGLANFFSLTWRQYSFGITAGFGLAASGILVAVVVRSVSGTRYAGVLQFVPSVTYLLALLIWLLSFWRPTRYPSEHINHLLTEHGVTAEEDQWYMPANERDRRWFPISFLSFHLAATVAAVIYSVRGNLARFPYRSAMDVATFLRGGHPKRMLELMNPEFDRNTNSRIRLLLLQNNPAQ